MSRVVKIKSKGIKNVLSPYQISKAIAEYIWNGFDAEANQVVVDYQSRSNGNIRKLIIKDNGNGIPFEELDNKFGPFHQSEKIDDHQEKSFSLPHGHKGIGRLTFFKFANSAIWSTVYEKDSKRYKYQISINSRDLDNYTVIKSETDGIKILEKLTETNEATGTVVEFDGFVVVKERNRNVCEEFIDYLKREFGWLMELFEHKQYKLIINGNQLDYMSIVGEKDVFEKETALDHIPLNVKYIRWNKLINKEYSYYYYLNSSGEEVYKETTKLNNQGDEFYHSVYVQSKLFDEFKFIPTPEDASQKTLNFDKSSDIFKELKNDLDQYLIKKRRPFLKEHSHEVLADFEKDISILRIDEDKDDELIKIQKEELREVVTELYEFEPKIFSKLNSEQKQIFIRLLKSLLDSNERENLIEIISEIVALSHEDRIELGKLLKTNQLTKIIKTIKFINHRYQVVGGLEQLIYNRSLNANERDHLQKVIEENTWLFGEKYNLVSADKSFHKALFKYIHILDGGASINDEQSQTIKNRPDIFISQQQISSDHMHNIIIELKHPKRKIGEKEISQVKKYMRIVQQEPRFNDHNAFWTFILIGTEFDTSGYIENEIQNMDRYGESGLILKVDNTSIYVNTWSQVINEFNKRHDFINKNLEIQKEQLIENFNSPEEIVNIAQNPP